MSRHYHNVWRGGPFGRGWVAAPGRPAGCARPSGRAWCTGLLVLFVLWAGTALAQAPLISAARNDGVSRQDPDSTEHVSARTLHLESIHIEGNERVSDTKILSVIDLEPGMPVDVEIFEAARARLLATGYFVGVEFHTRRGATRGAIALNVEVEEGSAFRLETGFGYHDVHGWFLTILGARLDHAFGVDSHLRLGWRLGFRISGVDAEWEQPVSMKKRFGAGIRVFAYEQRHLFFNGQPQPARPSPDDVWRRFEQKIDRVGGELGLRYALGANTRASFGVQRQRIEPDSTFKDVEEDVNHPFDDLPSDLQASVEDRNIAGFFLRLHRDTRDDDRYPQRGSYMLLTLQANGKWAGGDEKFVKGTVDLREHVPLGGRLTIASRVTGGVTEKHTPYYERFYIGGIYSVRGFEEWSLSPTDGDDAYWMVSEELRFPLTRSGRHQPFLTGLVFFDAGQGWQWDESFTKDDIESAAGYGFRMRLPWVGTFGVDVGVPLTTGRTDDKFRVHSSLGFSF